MVRCKYFPTALQIETTLNAAADLFRQADREDDPAVSRDLNRRAMKHVLIITDPQERV